MSDQKAHSKEEIEQALALLERTKAQQAKQREKLKNDPEAKAKAAIRAKRLRVKDQLLKQKAVKAGIVVTDAEVEAAIKAA